MKKLTFSITLFVGLILIGNNLYGEHFTLKRVSRLESPIKQFDLVEINFSISVPAKNPIANIATPEGKILSLPAFYSPKEAVWKIRYRPSTIGKYYYCLTLKTTSGIYCSAFDWFKVTSNNKDGFIRKSQNNPFYFTFESGKPFFGIGYNIAWIQDNNIAAYEKYFQKLFNNGCNLTRIWINTPWSFPLETTEIGSYNDQTADKLDALLKLAEKYNIYVILVLDSYGSLMEEKGTWGENFWIKNPYNWANGGPCEKPWDFFTNKQAKQYYKDRLMYIVGRFSNSANIMAFELWNELDAPSDWIKEMSGFIKSINPHKQFITTSIGYPLANNFDESAIWDLSEVDIIDRHVYANQVSDSVENITSINKEFAKKYNKPIIIGEFGIDTNKSDAAIDKPGSGASLHNSIWASALSGSFSSALNWWWAEYVNAKNLYPHYQGLRNFSEDINWNSKNIKFLKTTPIMINKNLSKNNYSDIVLKTQDYFGDISYKEFTIDSNGNISGGIVNAYLQGFSKKNLIVKPLFHLDYPVDGKLTLQINAVSQGANLIIYLDGKEILNKKLPAGPGAGAWKKSLYLKDYNIYQCVYDIPITIDIPKGPHTIKLENTGKDWIKIDTITLNNYSSDAFAKVHSSGLQLDKDILFWIQNKEFSWENAARINKLQSIDGASFSIFDVENGNYLIKFYDTLKGSVLLEENAVAANNILNITLPSFSKDLACKIKKQE